MSESRTNLVLDPKFSPLQSAARITKVTNLPGFDRAAKPLPMLLPQGAVSPFALAQSCAQLGRNNDVLHYLHEAYERRELRLVSLQDDHSFDHLRSQPEFQKLQAKLNAPRPD